MSYYFTSSSSKQYCFVLMEIVKAGVHSGDRYEIYLDETEAKKRLEYVNINREKYVQEWIIEKKEIGKIYNIPPYGYERHIDQLKIEIDKLKLELDNKNKVENKIIL